MIECKVLCPWVEHNGRNEMLIALMFPAGSWADITGQEDRAITPAPNLLVAYGEVPDDHSFGLLTEDDLWLVLWWKQDNETHEANMRAVKLWLRRRGLLGRATYRAYKRSGVDGVRSWLKGKHKGPPALHIFGRSLAVSSEWTWDTLLRHIFRRG